LKHGIERALKSLVFQKLRQVLPLVFGKARPPSRLAMFVAIFVILPDLAEGFAIGVSLFVATLLNDTLGTREWEVYKYISVSRGTRRITTQPSVYNLATHHRSFLSRYWRAASTR
jgi:hypothetical protein